MGISTDQTQAIAAPAVTAPATLPATVKNPQALAPSFVRAVVANVAPTWTNPTMCSLLIQNRLPAKSGFSFPAGIGQWYQAGDLYNPKTGAIYPAGTTTPTGLVPAPGPFFNGPNNQGGTWVLADVNNKVVVQVLNGVSQAFPSSAAILVGTHVHTGSEDPNGNPMPQPVDLQHHTQNTIGNGQTPTDAPIAPTFDPASTYPTDLTSVISYATMAGVLQDFDVHPTITGFHAANAASNNGLCRLAWAIRRHADSVVYPWVFWAETDIPGLPAPTDSIALDFSYGQVINGLDYDMGAAYVTIGGVIGPVTAFVTGYTATNMQIPGHYMLGHTDYVPTVTPGIPAIGIEPAVPPVLILTDAISNGLTSAIQVAFAVTNQPTDGSLSRVGMWYRNSNATTGFQAAGSPNANGSAFSWSYYASVAAQGLGLAPADKPVVGYYVFVFADLSNGVTYDFGMTAEDTRGDETAVVTVTSTTTPTPAPPNINNGSANLVVDSEYEASSYTTGSGGFSHSQVATTNPHWTVTGTWGGSNMLLKGSCGAFAGPACEFGGGGTFEFRSSPITVIKDTVYTASAYFGQGGDGGTYYVKFLSADGSTTLATQNGSDWNNGRPSASYTTPSDGSITQVIFAYGITGGSVGTGDYIYLGKPMVQTGNLSGYVKGPLNPSAATTTSALVVAPEGTTGYTAITAPTITSDIVAPTTSVQQPQGSLRMVATGTGSALYEQTSSDPTTPVWVEVGLGTLADDTDVALTTLATGEVLTFNGTAWTNETPVTGAATLAALTDVDFTGLTAGQFLGYASTSATPTCRQRAFGDYSAGSIVVTLSEPALAGSTFVAYTAYCGTTPLPTGFTSVLNQPASNANLGTQIGTKTAVGGETAITFASVTQLYAGGVSACIEEWVGANAITVFTGTVGAAPKTLTLASFPAGSVIVAAESAYTPTGATPSVTGWTQYYHLGVGGGAGSLDIHETVATGTSQSFVFASNCVDDTDNAAYILFAISGSAGSAFVFETPPALANVDTAYPTSPSVGQLAYRSDLSTLAIWTGSAWVVV